MFENLDVPEDLKGRGDKLGGFTPFTSDIYNFDVVLAYADKSQGGAGSLNLHLKEKEGARVFRTTLWVTSGDAKGNKPYFVDKKGDQQMLPGYELANDLCMLTMGGNGLTKLKFTKKMINLYSFEEKGEIPQEKMVATDLMGKSITAGLIQKTVDKNIKDASGNYVPSGETRTETELDKFFRLKDGLTVTEVLAKATEAKFLSEWEAQNKGVVIDKSTKGTQPTNGGDKASADSANPFA